MTNFSSSTLWTRFKESFTDNLKSIERQDIEMLKLYGERKYFLKYKLLPKVAKDLDLIFDSNKEFLRVDYTFFYKKDEHNWKVPVISIESENNWESSEEEVLKLLSINVPLKILILYNLSSVQLDTYIHSHDSDWNYMFEDFNEVSTNVGHFVVLIFDCIDIESISIICSIYDSKGGPVGQIETLQIHR